MKTVLIISVVLLLAIPAGLYFAGLPPFAHAEAAENAENAAPVVVEKVPHYLTLDPPFVVNFQHRGTLRYLQLSLDLMFYEEATLALVEQRMPAIRNDLILLFSNKDFETLSTPGGKELLRDEIMVAVSNVLELDPLTITDAGEVYITNFVMQ